MHADLSMCRCPVQAEHAAKTAQERELVDQQKIQELSWKSQELVISSRTRTRALLLANSELERRVQASWRHLLLTVPGSTYFTLLDRHTALHQSQLAAKYANVADCNKAEEASGDRSSPSPALVLQLEALHIEACKRAAQSEERERQMTAALQHSVAELQSQLAGDLQQRSVELGASQARAAQAASKVQRLSDDLTKAETLLAQAQSELAVQAKGML